MFLKKQWAFFFSVANISTGKQIASFTTTSQKRKQKPGHNQQVTKKSCINIQLFNIHFYYHFSHNHHHIKTSQGSLPAHYIIAHLKLILVSLHNTISEFLFILPRLINLLASNFTSSEFFS